MFWLMAITSTGDLTSSIVDVATALSQQRLKSLRSIAVLDKALDTQSRNALALLEALPSAAPSQQSESGRLVDTVA